MDAHKTAIDIERYLLSKGFKIGVVAMEHIAQIIEKAVLDGAKSKPKYGSDVVVFTPENAEALRRELCLLKRFERDPELPWPTSAKNLLRRCFPFSRRGYISLRRYYNAWIPEAEDFRRRTITTLMAGFHDEMDVAKRWESTIPSKPKNYESI